MDTILLSYRNTRHTVFDLGSPFPEMSLKHSSESEGIIPWKGLELLRHQLGVERPQSPEICSTPVALQSLYVFFAMTPLENPMAVRGCLSNVSYILAIRTTLFYNDTITPK